MFELELGYGLRLTRVSLAGFRHRIWGYGPPFIQLSLPTLQPKVGCLQLKRI